MLQVGVLGINFKTADLLVREAMARGAESLSDERAIFFPHANVVLSTCNRTEIYFSSDDLIRTHSDLLSHLRTQIDEPFEHRLYSYFGGDCLAHLCRVTSGLDSAIVAETEIQRQVKIAYARAQRLPSSLHYLFQKAFKIAKMVRSQLELKKGAPTLYSTIWKLGENFREGNILLVGNSEINRGFASFLKSKGVLEFSISTRNPKEAWEIDRSVPWQQFDLIVCATRADEFLISGSTNRRHLIFDLSVPRVVDPNIRAELYNMEQINQIIEQSQRAHTDTLERSEALIWDNVRRLIKIQRVQGTWERELRLVYSPSL